MDATLNHAARKKLKAARKKARNDQPHVQHFRRCICRKCHGKSRDAVTRGHGVWPGTVQRVGRRVFVDACGQVGSCGYSFECHLESEIEEREIVVIHNHRKKRIKIFVPPDEPETRGIQTEKYAIAMGLEIRTRAHRCSYIVPGCEKCGGWRPAGRRYCVSCEPFVAGELVNAGWSGEQVASWMRGEYPDEVKNG